MPLGALLGGALGTWLGLRPAIWVGACGAALSFLPILFSPVRGIREMPAPLEETGADAMLASESAEDGVVPARHQPYVETEES